LTAAAGVALIVVALRRDGKELDSYQKELEPYQLTLRPGFSALAAEPDWAELERYQNTIPRDVFLEQLQRVYSQDDAWRSNVEVHEKHAELRAGGNKRMRLHFAPADGITPERYWRAATELPDVDGLVSKPLQGLRIAIDPGHIGGEWAKVEERWYQIGGEGIEVMEGELTLATAKVLKTKLEMLGAEVWLLREKHQPVTRKRAVDFIELARSVLAKSGLAADGDALTKRSEQLFYRAHEIRQRARMINDDIQPDLALCLHYNAASWGDPDNPQLVPSNHLHLLINGTYSASEFRLEDNRFHLFKRLLQRTHDEELPINESVAAAMAKATGLSPYVYFTRNAKPVGHSGYVYARNLLANRIYDCPVVFLEPYVMNNQEVYQRVAAGDYEGEREVAGAMRKSLIREYADGVAEGLREYYAEARRR
jgi:N-acetylmuramoyl-L-alanine amidase